MNDFKAVQPYVAGDARLMAFVASDLRSALRAFSTLDTLTAGIYVERARQSAFAIVGTFHYKRANELVDAAVAYMRGRPFKVWGPL